MRGGRALRVLLVDDSAALRAELEEILAAAGHEVVGHAADGDAALRAAAALRPDLVLLDLQMPRMDGFTFLRLFMSRRPAPVIVLSSQSRRADVFKSLELGALDFVAKPEPGSLLGVRDELLAKCDVVRALRLENIPVLSPDEHAPPAPGPAIEPRRVVAIGASTGGPQAVQHLLQGLPPGLPVGFLVAQHMPEGFTRAFADRLGRTTPFAAVEAGEGEVVAEGRVLVAPGGRHLEVGRDARAGGALVARLAAPDAGGFSARYCPSVDRLFASAARALGARLCAVVLTGMGSDGREGVRAVKAAGGLALAESEETAVVYGMPQAAAATGAVDQLLPLPELAARIARFARGA